MINFCKKAKCPASSDLLAFQNEETPANKNASIQKHLADCEFCAAEIEFYARVPQAEEECAEMKMPAALYELADALLNNRQTSLRLLNNLLKPESVKI